jgi:hypothetical protein
MIVVQNKQIYCKNINGQWYLLKKGARHMHELSGSASTMWEALHKPISVDRLTKIVAKRYGVPVGSISDDITSFAQRLIQEGYLVIVE